MDIHKPKPVHNWRDFLKEIGIIVLGVSIALAAGPAVAAPSFGEGHPVTMGHDATAKYYDFTSAINSRTYRVFVSMPDGTAPKDGFPVIYVLDGNLTFVGASEFASVRAQLQNLKPAIVVGIGYPDERVEGLLSRRLKDLTTPIAPHRLETLRRREPNAYSDYRADQLGDMDGFLKVIGREIMPFVATLAPVASQDQALFGHSLGGLTVLRALFTEPGAFHTFIASSPSIWWDDRAVLRDEANLSHQVESGRVAPRILLEAGGLEEGEFHIRDDATTLGARLAALKGGNGYAVQTVVFADEGHVSAGAPAINRALSFDLALTPKEPPMEKK